MNTLFTPKCFRLTSAHFFHIRRNASFIDTKWWHSFKRKKRSESPDHWASSVEMRSTPTHTSCLTQKATQKVLIHYMRVVGGLISPSMTDASNLMHHFLSVYFTCRCFVLCTDFSFDSICCVQGHMTTVAGDRPTNQVINGQPRQLYSCSSSTSPCSSPMAAAAVKTVSHKLPDIFHLFSPIWKCAW